MLYKIMYKRIQRENIRYYHINNLNLRRKSQKREKTNKNLYNQYDKKSWHYIYMFLFYNICIYYMYPLGVLPSAAWEQRKHELCIVEGVINYMLLWPVVVLKMKVYFSFLICHIVIHVKNFPLFPVWEKMIDHLQSKYFNFDEMQHIKFFPSYHFLFLERKKIRHRQNKWFAQILTEKKTSLLPSSLASGYSGL